MLQETQLHIDDKGKSKIKEWKNNHININQKKTRMAILR